MPAAEGIFPKADNDVLYGSEANAVNYANIIAGENLTAGNIVYIKKNTGKAFISDTGTADDIRADGVVIANSTSGNVTKLMLRGNYVTTGLTANEVYYLGASGAISTTQSAVQVGIATATTNLFVDVIQDDSDPIGTVKHVLSNITGVPTYNRTAFWILADGTTISDAESPLNGQAVPDLNGDGKFIYAGDTAGGTKTEDFLVVHNHTQNSHAHTYSMDSSGGSTRPLGTNNAQGATPSVNGTVATNQATSATGTAWLGHAAVAIIKIK